MLLITGHITEASYESLAKYLAALGGKDALLQINSEGGSSLDGIAMYSLIKDYPGHVTAIAVGSCMSIAVLVYAAADDRWAAPETWFMLHESADRIKGETSQIVTATKFLISQDAQYCTLLEEATGTPAKRWARLCKPTSYLTAGQLEELGLVHTILKGKR